MTSRGERKRRSKLPSMPSSLAPGSGGNNESPQFNVDYFSHPWNEMDLKASWSVITKRKYSHTDGVRLENASWRKWMQQRFQLRKVNPELLRWKKDEDITWLYGPFCRTNFTEDLLLRSSQVICTPLPDGGDVDDNNNMTMPTSTHSSPVAGVAGGERCEYVQDSPVQNNKKSSLKMRSIIGDLKKFQLESDVALARKNLATAHTVPSFDRPQRSPTQPRKVKHSKSESEIHRIDSVFISQKSPPNTVARFAGPAADPIPAAPEPLAVSKPQNTSNRLRFNNEVEVLEYDQHDWKNVNDPSITKKGRGDPGDKCKNQQPYKVLSAGAHGKVTDTANETLMDAGSKASSPSSRTDTDIATDSSGQVSSQPVPGSGWFQTVFDVTSGFLTGKFFR